MNREQSKHFIQGAIGTLPTAFDKRMNIDHGKMAAYTKWWVSEGLGKPFSGLKVACRDGRRPVFDPVRMASPSQYRSDSCGIGCKCTLCSSGRRYIADN